MKITILCLDNEEGFLRSLQINISSLDSNFFNSFETKITGIDVLTATEPEDAFRIINSRKVDVIVLDIELSGGQQGHEEYEKLFYRGKAIPAIVLSAFATTPDRQNEIRAKGISTIIDKFEEDLSEKVAKAVCSAFENRRERILQIRTFVERFRIHNKVVQHNGQSVKIEDLIVKIISGTITTIEENEIRNILIGECIDASRLEQDHNEGFTRES